MARGRHAQWLDELEILLAAYERHDSIGIAGVEEVVNAHAFVTLNLQDIIPSLLLLCD